MAEAFVKTFKRDDVYTNDCESADQVIAKPKEWFEDYNQAPHSALDSYHLTDQIPRHLWIMVPSQKRIVSKQIKTIRSPSPRWQIGIVEQSGYSITTIERTLIDCLIFQKTIGTQTAIDALKMALKEKRVKLGDLIQMAKTMSVPHRVLSFVSLLFLLLFSFPFPPVNDLSHLVKQSRGFHSSKAI